MSNDNSSSGFPSLTALLGLLAVAGYQNRDKIAEWLGGRGEPESGQAPVPPQPGQASGAPQADGGLLGGLGGLFGAGGVGGLLNGGLGELADRFRQAGHGETVDSWVQQGPNREVAPGDLEQALGPQVIDAIARRTGLSRGDLLARLSQVLPEAVDRYTPDGRFDRAGA